MANERLKQLPKTYDPKQVEDKWYNYWLENGLFRATGDEDKQKFSVVIPPPNVTGVLHIGHALDFTLQDIIVRMKRMQGYDTLWLPGTDHAGISTQAKVEEALRKENVSRHDLGREKFLEKVWEWKAHYAQAIRDQWRNIGLSLDYSRERFTLDEGLSRAVREVFVRLYEKGLIYRGKYIINWDPETGTALSDIEVEHKEVTGALYHMKYPLKDGSGHISVATTRPETMLGDTAVAVHPDDERYRHLVGKTVVLPIVGREIPIIADDYVDMTFGSGAVKITPAHDPNDFEIGMRHNLPQVLVMDETGKMNENAGKYCGMDRFECRKQIVKDLQAEGVLFRIEEHVHAVGHSQRSGAVVEPYLSTQWFVKMKPLAEQAIQVQRSGKGVRFVPERFEKIYLHWIENVRDWCISRQLWWGHRIPAWYCDACGKTTVSREDATTCGHCGSADIQQDEDVLDTWFSSALWPFSTMGWPEETDDLKRYYPTDVLVTGYDIIYFWVARMIFTALEFTGEIPFRDVLIHGLVRDAEGRKMSKSLGNGVDPLDVIDKYGADAMRYMISTGIAPGQDLRFHWERVEMARNFANKIWNASRFVLMNLDGFTAGATDWPGALATPDQWILHRLNETVKEVTRQLDRYEFGEAGRTLYNFIWDEFCDWYIELAKIALYGDDAAAKRTTQSVLTYVLDRILRLLHPFMPFITEEIWQHLPTSGVSIAVEPWPEVSSAHHFPEAVADMGLIMDIVRSVRNIRAESGVAANREVALIVRPNAAHLAAVERSKDYIGKLAKVGTLTVDLDAKRPEKALSAVVSGAELYLPLAGLIDVEKELARLRKELAHLDEEVARVERKLASEGFVSKAPAHVVERERQKGGDYREKREKVRERIKMLEGS